MTRVIIYHSDRFDVVSYGNGLSYAIHDKINKISAFVQGDDASEFRAELEQWENLFPETHYDEFYSEQIAIRIGGYRFTEAYIECTLWSSSEGEIRLDEYEGDIAPETLAQMERDCAEFQQENAALLDAWYALGESEERAGQDFWLTRNHHGAGFWDRFHDGAEGGHIGKLLTDAAHAYGDCDLYIGDDGQIYAR